MSALTGRHALITGAGSGIGAAIARALADAGAAVSLAGRRPAPLEAVAAQLPKAKAIVADVTRQIDCETMALAARNAHGPIDIVIANVGGAESASFKETDQMLWRRMIDVNLTGAFFTVKATIDDVTRTTRPDDITLTAPDPYRSRRIIFVASTAGLKGYPYVAAYTAAKHGLIGLMRSLAAEFATKNVTVNAVCPGYTETPMLERSITTITTKTGRTSDEARSTLARSNPQGRIIKPAEVAQTVLWLCSPEAAGINGQAISISGGEV
ncbi:MAG TPA: SDR family NAD(P)-dependent oxidoreductase [Xanthobacteraceae bacterium]|nr:SDR family NAD(P)-dependent oxidoreductase [Xanthobacteraceae bacterium]